MSVFNSWSPRSNPSSAPPNRSGFTQLPQPTESTSPGSVVAEHVEHVGKGKGSYEVVEKLIWVGPGRGDFTLEETAPSPRKDDCVNPPEAVARGEGFFRKGAVVRFVYRCGVGTIVTLLGVGILCLLCSFCFPGAIDSLLIQATSSHEESTTAAPSLPEPPEAEDDAEPVEVEALPGGAVEAEKKHSRSSGAELDSSEFDSVDAKKMRRSLCEDVSNLASKNSTNQGSMRGAKIAGIEEQLDWCCRNEGIGCKEFDCDSEWSTWELTWSELKKQWCCAHFSRGCVAVAA